MSGITARQEISDADLRRYAGMVYEKTGIRISPQKKLLLSNRIQRRLKVTGIDGFGAYLRHLTSLKTTDAEWEAFLQEITTHETYLFRDEPQWEWFQEEYLREIASDAREGRRPRALRIWSAACSTGDECFTIATCVAAKLTDLSQWNVRIVGTDIGVGALAEARQAEFGERAMRLVPDGLKRRFFTKAPTAELWRAKPALSSMIAFRQHNLIDPLRESPFDLVILKNVLIYFDTESKKVVMGHLRSIIKPDGYLIAGAAEGVSSELRDMRRCQAWLYQQPRTQSSGK